MGTHVAVLPRMKYFLLFALCLCPIFTFARPILEPREIAPFSQPGANDKVATFIDRLHFTRLEDLEAKQLTSAVIKEGPWSDSYWPLYLGTLAFRYGDKMYPLSLDWRVNNSYMMKNLGTAPDIGDISPAEKYDLLIGSQNFNFTRVMLKKGKDNLGNDGVVPKWMGICHGWAPASMAVPRPKNMVPVQVADGRIIPFYPSDIKALVTLLWAKTEIRKNAIGSRCMELKIRRDSNGRAIDPDCRDTNPATWHLAVTNQFGYDRKSFIMDSVSNREVWNYVVTSYKYNYFNPVTSQSGTTLVDARVSTEEFKKDKFKKFRAPGTRYIVGIEMDVTYTDEAPPVKQQVDNSSFDLTVLKKFRYDLELNEKGQIIGGEWHSEVHPDFLWQTDQVESPLAYGDHLLSDDGDRSEWEYGKPLPESWARAARLSISREQPLQKIVESLVAFSNCRPGDILCH